MEKFTKWRDRGTGLAPFFQNSFEIQSPKWVFLILGIFLYIIRHLFIFFLFISYIIFVHVILSAIFQPLFPGMVHFVKKLYIGSVFIICGISLSSFQINYTKKKRTVPCAQDIIISCYCSPLDILCLIYNYDPIFTISFSNTSLVQHVSGLKALFYTFSVPKRSPYKNYTTLDSLSKLYPNRIISVFPEGTTSNGNGLLLFTQSLESVTPQAKIFPLSIKYSNYLTTPLPGSFFIFLLRFTFKLTHNFQIKISETPIIADHPEKLGEIASIALSKLSKIPRLELGVNEKISFLKAWKTFSKV
ncbi:hypothetical protein T552_03198 [Pneumocystis carinii B80]|uniref:Phospholipid/glycerol acyltransferase domain-containing protein n=1 Tax=Pneumocystis carinii (strain B80) TaxID=1408658 RepID=A0A0W4ZBY2_PNEC8|nr:hypothetical protein T552_03198 [Pneumocystis carinii B80]KTW25924.1 hypothetical protein T552_03198 [Pneumocystis carinii B80]